MREEGEERDIKEEREKKHGREPGESLLWTPGQR